MLILLILRNHSLAAAPARTVSVRANRNLTAVRNAYKKSLEDAVIGVFEAWKPNEDAVTDLNPNTAAV